MTDGYNYKFNNIVYPVNVAVEPILATNDPVLYVLSGYLINIINNYLSDSFQMEATATNIVSGQQGYNWASGAVGTVLSFPPNPNILLSTSLTFPLVSIYREEELDVQFTLRRVMTKSKFCLQYVLPPLEVKQYNRLYSFLTLLSKTFLHFMFQGHDPLYQNAAAIFREIGVKSFDLNGAKYNPLVVMKGSDQLFFPTVTIRFDANEPAYFVHQGIVLDGFGIQVLNVNQSLPADPIDIADGYLTSFLTIDSITPNNGSIAGNTLCIIQGTGFDALTSVSLAGVPVLPTNIIPSSNQKVIVRTTPTLTPITGDVVLTNTFGITATIPNGFTYT